MVLAEAVPTSPATDHPLTGATPRAPHHRRRASCSRQERERERERESERESPATVGSDSSGCRLALARALALPCATSAARVRTTPTSLAIVSPARSAVWRSAQWYVATAGHACMHASLLAPSRRMRSARRSATDWNPPSLACICSASASPRAVSRAAGTADADRSNHVDGTAGNRFAGSSRSQSRCDGASRQAPPAQ
jgi:hypothetical protein